MVRPDDGGVDHLKRIGHGLGSRQGFQYNVPQPRTRPSQELAIHRTPFAQFLRQIAPRRASSRDPENTIQDAPMIGGRSPPLGACLDHKLLEQCPFRIRQPASNQFCLPPRDSFKSSRNSPVNHFVNNT